ncbi:AN1-type zinc finger protein 4, partial [Caerostris darwini]
MKQFQRSFPVKNLIHFHGCAMKDFLFRYDIMAENRMELFIETLTGTAFELSCSPLETIVSIKAKIQYSEGIPVSQQHLIWKSQELNDDLCLQDYSINDGATLKLVLGMRGGPINTRQVTDTKKLKDLAEYVERN